MAEKIELQIVADNSDVITKTKQVSDAMDSMTKSAKHVYTGQKGLIEGLEEDLKNLEAQRRKAFTNKEVGAYRDWET